MRTKQVPTDSLNSHPLNTVIYGSDGMTPSFVANVRDNGILVPLAILANGTIISGHRRWQAAQECGLDTVPVHVVNFNSDLDERQALLNYNRQRDKTFSQKMAEAAELEAIEREKAKKRISDAGKSSAPGRKGKETLPDLSKGQTRDTVAQAIGLSGRSYDKAKKVVTAARAGDPVAKKELARLDSGATTIHAAYIEVTVAEQHRERQARHRKILKNLPPADERYKVICGDIAEVYKDLPEVDCIITDPPYDQEGIPLFGTLAKVSAHLLRPGGSLLAEAGHIHLPAILAEMSKVKGVSYHWTLCYLLPGNHNAQIYGRKVGVRWRPVLWFVKGEYEGQMRGDVITSDGRDKRYHEWGKSESGILELVDLFSEPGDLVLDTFCGGGTTGVACLSLGRRFIGVDIDADCVATTLARIGELVTPL